MATSKSRQRSFRLPSDLLSALEHRAAETGLSVNALAQRYLTEGLRLDRHPKIMFWTRPGGREAMLAGHRLSIADVMETVRLKRGSVKATAKHLRLAAAEVQAAVAYYADHPDEIDALIKQKLEFARAEQAAFERRRRALGA